MEGGGEHGRFGLKDLDFVNWNVAEVEDYGRKEGEKFPPLPEAFPALPDGMFLTPGEKEEGQV